MNNFLSALKAGLLLGILSGDLGVGAALIVLLIVVHEYYSFDKESYSDVTLNKVTLAINIAFFIATFTVFLPLKAAALVLLISTVYYAVEERKQVA